MFPSPGSVQLGSKEGELLAARQSSGVFQCKKIRRRNTSPSLDMVPTPSLLPSWQNLQSSPALLLHLYTQGHPGRRPWSGRGQE